MGTLHLPDKRNLAVVLLEGGLARRVGAAADRSTHAFELAAAEESAQGASLKVWENYAAEKAAAEAAAAAAAAAEEEAPLDDADKQVTELNLTEIVDGTRRVSETQRRRTAHASSSSLPPRYTLPLQAPTSSRTSPATPPSTSCSASSPPRAAPRRAAR